MRTAKTLIRLGGCHVSFGDVTHQFYGRKLHFAAPLKCHSNMKFPTIKLKFTSPNDNFEYSCPPNINIIISVGLSAPGVDVWCERRNWYGPRFVLETFTTDSMGMCSIYHCRAWKILDLTLIFHPYQLDESISKFWGVWWVFLFLAHLSRRLIGELIV